MRRRHGWRWLSIAPILVGCSGDAAGTEPFAAVEFGSDRPVSTDDYLGTPILLAGWATWCVPCERELPELDAFIERRDDLFVVAVNIDQATVADDDVDAMLRRLDVSLPVWRDTDGLLLTRYEGSMMPFSVLLDGDGEVAATWIGALDTDDDEFLDTISDVTG